MKGSKDRQGLHLLPCQITQGDALIMLTRSLEGDIFSSLEKYD
jgi:hypothetical protein